MDDKKFEHDHFQKDTGTGFIFNTSEPVRNRQLSNLFQHEPVRLKGHLVYTNTNSYSTCSTGITRHIYQNNVCTGFLCGEFSAEAWHLVTDTQLTHTQLTHTHSSQLTNTHHSHTTHKHTTHTHTRAHTHITHTHNSLTTHSHTHNLPTSTFTLRGRRGTYVCRRCRRGRLPGRRGT